MDATADAMKLLANIYRQLSICQSLAGRKLDDPYRMVGAELPVAGIVVTVTEEMVSAALLKAHHDQIAWNENFEGRKDERNAVRCHGR